MVGNRTSAIAFAMALVLSGCVAASEGAEKSAPTSTVPPAPPAEASAETGGIDGTVTDDSLLPIPGADVVILDQNRSTTTDAEGRFSFSDLPPGKLRIVATKLGYTQEGRVLEIVAGEVLDVSFVLEPLSIKEPYYRTQTQAAFIGCSIDVRQSNQNGSILTFAACGLIYYTGATQVDRFRLDWDLGDVTNTTGLFAESSWRSTQAAGTGLYVWWVTYKGDIFTSLLQVRGKTPLRGLIEGDQFLKNKGDNKGSSSLCVNACHLTTFHYTWANTFNGQYPYEAGVTVQQRIDDYVSVFFDAEPPENFTVLPPG